MDWTEIAITICIRILMVLSFVGLLVCFVFGVVMLVRAAL